MLLKRHPEQARQVDSQGNLPLHYAVSGIFASDSENGDCCCNDNESQKHQRQLRLQVYANVLVNNLLKLYPEAVLLPDGNGRLPLFIALQASTLTWNRQVILKLAAIQVLHSQNDDDGLTTPFLESARHADKSRFHLSVSYELLLKTPEIVQQAIP